MKNIFILSLVLFSSQLWGEETQSLIGSFTEKFGTFNFEIHFAADDKNYAAKIRDIIIDDGKKLSVYFETVPKETVHFILDVNAKSSNGEATVFPTNVIVLNDFPPVGNEYLTVSHDWLRTLIVHELTHVLTLEKISGGPLKWISYVFGSTANLLSSLIPNWYSEGIAVWAESKFTGEGRLKATALRAELYNKLRDPLFCKTIDCLDSPGAYPYKQFPYWVGADFLNSLEESSPNTIQCLVNTNSKSFPFFLNHAFQACSGKDVNILFQDYLSQIDIEKTVEQTARESGDIFWQKGVNIIGKRVLYVESYDRKDYITLYDYAVSKKTEILLNGRISAVSRNVFDVDKQEFINKDRMYVLLKDLASNNRTYVIDTAGDIAAEEVVGVSGDAVFPVGDNNFYTLKYTGSQWSLHYNQKTIYQFPRFFNIYSPQMFKLNNVFHLSFITGVVEKTFMVMQLSSLGEEAFFTVFKQKDNLDFVDYCLYSGSVGFVFKNQKESSWSLLFDPEFSRLIGSQGSKKVVNYNLPQKIVDINFAKDSTLVNAGDGYLSVSNKGCQKFFASFLIESIDKNIAPTERIDPIKADDKVVLVDTHSYPRLKHFWPHYWLLTYENVNNVNLFTAQTSLSDPKKNHTIDLAGTWYSDIAKTAPVVSYLYKHKDWWTQLSYIQSYSQSIISDQTEKNDATTFAVGRDFTYSKSKWSPSAYYYMENVDDFISSRDFVRIGITNQFSLLSAENGFLLQHANLVVKNFYQDTENRDSFWGVELRGDVNLELSSRQGLLLKGTFGKLFSNKLSSGVLYGGGDVSGLYGLTRFHDFYGLQFGSMFGRKIYTFRAQWRLLLWELYRGAGLLPIFLKEWKLLVGGDYAKTDFVFLGKYLFSEESLFSVHTGVESNFILFYNLPVSLDVIVANVRNSPVKNDLELLFLLNMAIP